MNTNETNTTARLATLDELKKTTLPAFLSPIPSDETLRAWFSDLPQFKANPTAARGGGPVYYLVSAVEKMLRGRVLPRAASMLRLRSLPLAGAMARGHGAVMG